MRYDIDNLNDIRFALGFAIFLSIGLDTHTVVAMPEKGFYIRQSDNP